MKWYLIQTKPTGHLIAPEHLKRQNFEVFLPLIKKTSRKGGKFVNVTIPLFPNYLFIGTKSDQVSWKSVNATRGISKAVTFDGIYRTVDDQIIQNLKCRCDSKSVISRHSEIASGDYVKIENGPLSDFICKVETIEASRRVWVLFEFMKQKTKAKVSLSDLSKV